MNSLNKNKRIIQLKPELHLNDAAVDTQQPADQLIEQAETNELLQKNLNNLPLEYREPLVLFYLEEKSYNEISDVLHLPINTVGTRISRGKKMLMQFYSKKNHE